MINYLKTLHQQNTTRLGIIQVATGVIELMNGNRTSGLSNIIFGIIGVLWPEKVPPKNDFGIMK